MGKKGSARGWLGGIAKLCKLDRTEACWIPRVNGVVIKFHHTNLVIAVRPT